MKIHVTASRVEVDLGRGDIVALTAEEATRAAQDLHCAATALRLAQATQRRYDAEKRAIENVLNRSKSGR